MTHVAFWCMFIAIIAVACNSRLVASSFAPVYFPINNGTTVPPFANHTRIEDLKVFLVRTNHPISVILPDLTKQGKSKLEKVSKQVHNTKNGMHRCTTVATNGGPFNADGTCVGPVVSRGVLRQNSTSVWPGFGRGSSRDNDSHFYVLGDYSKVIEQGSTMLSDFVTGFGWLVYNGQIVASEDDNPTGAAQAPRTTIGVDKDGHWILLVADGCERCVPPYHPGMTLTEVAAALVNQANVEYAINLDGGSSSTMVVDGNVVNRPMCLDVVPVKCQRPVATVICVEEPSTTDDNSNEKRGRDYDWTRQGTVPGVNTRTTRRKEIEP